MLACTMRPSLWSRLCDAVGLGRAANPTYRAGCAAPGTSAALMPLTCMRNGAAGVRGALVCESKATADARPGPTLRSATARGLQCQTHAEEDSSLGRAPAANWASSSIKRPATASGHFRAGAARVVELRILAGLLRCWVAVVVRRPQAAITAWLCGDEVQLMSPHSCSMRQIAPAKPGSRERNVMDSLPALQQRVPLPA